MNIIKHSMEKCFEIKVPGGREITYNGYDNPDHPNVPSKIDEYFFRRESLRDCLAFLKKPRGDAMFITGPTGSGKTSLVEQIAARLNYPVQAVTASEDLTFNDLVGQFVLKSPSPGETPEMSWQDGPLTIAIREGHLFLLNEGDILDPSELSGLNEVLSGKPLVVTQNGGEVIKPHSMFRVFVTGNTNGQGDSTGVYLGTLQQNIAAMDRYRMMEIGYMDSKDEATLLSKMFPEVAEEIIKSMVRVANSVRSVFDGNDPNASLGITMSTRTLVRWAGLSVDFRKAEKPLQYSLSRALLLRGNDEEREAINQICSSVFGEKLWYGK